uniref:Uncharacterized protein n=1 Tax=Ascaris lumbricoides TaxID=6252 RepID=A0A0M3I5J3_ASCLU
MSRLNDQSPLRLQSISFASSLLIAIFAELAEQLECNRNYFSQPAQVTLRKLYRLF